MSDATQDFSRQLLAGLEKLGEYRRAASWRARETQGLTPTQARVLTLLAGRDMRMGELAEAMSIRQPTASEAVGALVKKELVRKVAAPEDARAIRLQLTAKGRRKTGHAGNIPSELAAAVETLSLAEQATMLRALTRIIRALQLQGAIPVQRMCTSCAYFRPNVHDNPATPHHCQFVDAAFGDAQLRLECGDHQSVGKSAANVLWHAFDGEDTA